MTEESDEMCVALISLVAEAGDLPVWRGSYALTSIILFVDYELFSEIELLLSSPSVTDVVVSPLFTTC